MVPANALHVLRWIALVDNFQSDLIAKLSLHLRKTIGKSALDVGHDIDAGPPALRIKAM